MTQATSGDTVKVHYTGTLTDGSEFDSSVGGEPLEITLGAGGVIPGFEQAVLGMAEGDSRTVTIAADEAYGAHHDDRVHEVERGQIPDDIDLEIGAILQAVGSGGETLAVTVVGFSDAAVTLDFNHPLAGKDLTFEVKLVEILSG
jgi:peptidylprolyl isomerase